MGIASKKIHAQWATVACAFSFAIIALSALSGCRQADGNLNEVLGIDFVEGVQGPIPYGIDPKTGAGSGCGNENPDHICLAVKYVAYSDRYGYPVVTQSAAQAAISDVNELWRQCGLSFVLEDYQAVQPLNLGLEFNLSSYGGLTQARQTFRNDSRLLLVTTGSWNRSGSIGETGANAWAQLPGSTPYGVVMESSVGTNGNLIAHELGHYLNLLHVSDRTAMMNPVIYSISENIYSSQCDTARVAAKYYWAGMIR